MLELYSPVDVRLLVFTALVTDTLLVFRLLCSLGEGDGIGQVKMPQTPLVLPRFNHFIEQILGGLW